MNKFVENGDVVRIKIGLKEYAYARVLENPLCAFYDYKTSDFTEIDVIIQKPILFKVWIANYSYKEDNWEIVGNRPLDAITSEIPWFFKKDTITKKLSLYRNGEERKATLQEVEGLECAAVWNPEHIEDRLRDHFAGRENKWVRSLSPDS